MIFYRKSTLFHINGTPIFINPSKSEIIEIYKSSKNKEARFLAVQKTKKIYVWDADQFIHITAFIHLKDSNILPKNSVFTDFLNFYAGVCKIESGSLTYKSSDEIDYYANQYELKKFKWRSDAEDQEEFFYSNAKRIYDSFRFLDKYMSGFSNENNPYLLIHKYLHKE